MKIVPRRIPNISGSMAHGPIYRLAGSQSRSSNRIFFWKFVSAQKGQPISPPGE